MRVILIMSLEAIKWPNGPGRLCKAQTVCSRDCVQCSVRHRLCAAQCLQGGQSLAAGKWGKSRAQTWSSFCARHSLHTALNCTELLPIPIPIPIPISISIPIRSKRPSKQPASQSRSLWPGNKIKTPAHRRLSLGAKCRCYCPLLNLLPAAQCNAFPMACPACSCVQRAQAIDVSLSGSPRRPLASSCASSRLPLALGGRAESRALRAARMQPQRAFSSSSSGP